MSVQLTRRDFAIRVAKMINLNPNRKTTAFFLSLLLTILLSAVVSAQQKPTTGYAPVNGLKMYYEIHGSGEPVVLLHGAFMAITDDWSVWISELSKTPSKCRVTLIQLCRAFWKRSR
ncbi:MAG: alpha/beta fold hydrolase [Pyrinomonadaceae bacterium]